MNAEAFFTRWKNLSLPTQVSRGPCFLNEMKSSVKRFVQIVDNNNLIQQSGEEEGGGKNKLEEKVEESL